jgi:hypothetical protein
LEGEKKQEGGAEPLGVFTIVNENIIVKPMPTTPPPPPPKPAPGAPRKRRSLRRIRRNLFRDPVEAGLSDLEI